jgi:RHS repeat-associated protein
VNIRHEKTIGLATRPTGTPCYEVDYLPYGTENTPAGFTNTCPTRYQFTGYERDAETAYGTSSGNDYAVARYYNARLGRFMSGDPLDGDITDPQTLNRYAYVRNNSSNFTDPSGQFLWGGPQPPPDPGYSYYDDSGPGNCLGSGGIPGFMSDGGCGSWRWPALPVSASQVKPPAPKPNKSSKCFKPTRFQKLGIAAQAWLARKWNKDVGFGVGGSVGAGKIAFGWFYSASQQMVVSPTGQAALVTTLGQANIGPMPGIVHGVGVMSGVQGSIGSPTTSPDQLAGNSFDFGGGGNRGPGWGLGFAQDASISDSGAWQTNTTVGAAWGTNGHAASVQTSSVLPACEE